MSDELKTFREAVEADAILSCYRAGLRGLGAYSKKIRVKETRLCKGSIDIDKCLSAKYPQANRWDYCFGYGDEVFFIEVHPAITSEVDTVIRKLQWLRQWLNDEAPELNKLKATTRTPFYWVQSSNFNIPTTSKQYKKATQAGIKPISVLDLT